MDAIATLVPFALIAVVFWLLMIRPAQRKQREARAVQNAADVGSEVMLTSGIYGHVTQTGEGTLWVEIAPGTTIKVARAAIMTVIRPDDEPVLDAQADAPSDVQSDVDDTPDTPNQ